MDVPLPKRANIKGEIKAFPYRGNPRSFIDPAVGRLDHSYAGSCRLAEDLRGNRCSQVGVTLLEIALVVHLTVLK